MYGNASGNELGRGGNALRKAVTREKTGNAFLKSKIYTKKTKLTT